VTVRSQLEFVSVWVMSRVDIAFDQSNKSVTVLFGERFAQSEQFDEVFAEGMELVERTAAYLDGQGRKDSRALKPPVSVAYATESMRLTTRLLELASWLLVQRGLRDGEISKDEALERREQVKLRTFGRPQSIKFFETLPAGLKGLIVESVTLMDRIVLLDEGMRLGSDEITEPAASANPVGGQIAALHQAFVGRFAARNSS
jgi:regulator of CtrA degradation